VIFTLFLAGMTYLFAGDGPPPSTHSPSPQPIAFVQAAMPIPNPLLSGTPEASAQPEVSATPSRVSAFEMIAQLKDQPRPTWSKTIGPPAESHPSDKHNAGSDTWKIGELKMTVKWGRSKFGLIADDINIDAEADASELGLAEAKQIAIYFGLTNSLITYPNEKTPWYIWHNAGDTPLASFGPESARLVDGKLVPENRNLGLSIIISHGNPAPRTTPLTGQVIPGMQGSAPMPLHQHNR
jgi:hypothetical protein